MREVDDAVRQDEMASMARRYALPAGAAIAALLLAVGGVLWWRGHNAAAAGERGEALTQALDQVQAARVDDAARTLGPLAADGDGIGGAARLAQGGLAESRGRPDDAGKAFAALAGDGDAPRPLRDLASIRDVAARFDALPPQQVIDRLKPLAVPGNPWFGNAGELVALAYLKQNQRELAGPLLVSIAKDDATAETLRRRARQLAAQLGVDDVAKPTAQGASSSGAR